MKMEYLSFAIVFMWKIGANKSGNSFEKGEDKMSFKEGHWMYNSRPDDVWNTYDYYDTKEEAISGGKEYYALDEIEVFYVGQIENCNIVVGVDASRILEDISLNVYDEVGEAAEDYLDDVKREHENILEERLNKVVLEWIEEFKYKPNFFTIDNVEKIKLE